MADERKSISREDNFDFAKFYEENGLNKLNSSDEPEWRPITPDRKEAWRKEEARRKKPGS